MMSWMHSGSWITIETVRIMHTLIFCKYINWVDIYIL